MPECAPPDTVPDAALTVSERLVIAKARELLHGEVLVKVQDGRIVYVTKTEGFKPQERKEDER